MKINSFLVRQRTNKKIVQQDLDSLNFLGKLDMLLKEQRCQRYDLKILSEKLDKLLVDKHLQKQVDTYFDEDSEHTPEEEQ